MLSFSLGINSFGSGLLVSPMLLQRRFEDTVEYVSYISLYRLYCLMLFACCITMNVVFLLITLLHLLGGVVKFVTSDLP
ncbi:hypothetical protein IC582_021998 [Cucumis melo]